jgi:hypothetical protein
MPNVRIVLVEHQYVGDYDEHHCLYEGISDWEQITDEELTLLRYHLNKIHPKEYSGYIPIVLVKDLKPVSERITSIKAYLVKKDLEEKKRQANYEKENAEKIAATKEKKKQKELKLFEELKAKFEKEFALSENQETP